MTETAEIAQAPTTANQTSKSRDWILSTVFTFNKSPLWLIISLAYHGVWGLLCFILGLTSLGFTQYGPAYFFDTEGVMIQPKFGQTYLIADGFIHILCALLSFLLTTQSKNAISGLQTIETPLIGIRQTEMRELPGKRGFLYNMFSQATLLLFSFSLTFYNVFQLPRLFLYTLAELTFEMTSMTYIGVFVAFNIVLRIIEYLFHFWRFISVLASLLYWEDLFQGNKSEDPAKIS
ncbi:hypothetical protein BLNAU_19466 [Blattamonas nauphoetae]|uniref:Uncharacterized protein n=1 Tax=Blattamonas nauphoetae TaxID=2049346 RepID=A0ABQ9X4N2_9EUKA|nr:hypothetical protein BLNAU_19466 [Blattamonas nauphoetae]